MLLGIEISWKGRGDIHLKRKYDAIESEHIINTVNLSVHHIAIFAA